MGNYRYVMHNGEQLFNVGILPDGRLYNPRGYPEDVVRAAVTAADARRHERRSHAAKKAAATCAVRKERLVHEIAKRYVAGEKIGPRNYCAICGKKLSASEAKARGIGSECWQGLLSVIAAIRAKANPTLPGIE
jgi:hypothetical protein